MSSSETGHIIEADSLPDGSFSAVRIRGKVAYTNNK